MSELILPWHGRKHTRVFHDIDKAVAYAAAIEQHQKSALASAFEDYEKYGPYKCDEKIRDKKFFRVGAPYMRIDASLFPRPKRRTLGSNFFGDRGVYETSLANLDLFGERLAKNLKKAKENHGLKDMPIEVGVDSTTPMPLQCAVARIDYEDAKNDYLKVFFNIFSTLDAHNNRLDVIEPHNSTKPYPLTFFEAPRTYFLKHQFERYTNTGAEFAANCWVLFNFPRLVKLFEEQALDVLRGNPPAWLERPEEFVELITPGNLRYTREHPNTPEQAAPSISKGDVQMPAYHFRRADGTGFSCALIGVGPSNAKNFTDKLALLRPDLVLMGGICAGFGPTMRKGDLVLAHSFVRRDHVLDDVMPRDIVPSPLQEVSSPIREAVSEIFGLDPQQRRERMRECTVMTVDDRESDTKRRIYEDVMLSSANALDMESATVATNCKRHGISYGFLGICSDRPYDGDVRLAVSASNLQDTHFRDFIAVLTRAQQLFSQRPDDFPSRKLYRPSRHPALNA